MTTTDIRPAPENAREFASAPGVARPLPPKFCFVSYKRLDSKRVEPLVQALRSSGVEVWWDRDLEGGQIWRQVLSERLQPAACVLVCWTKSSVADPGGWVIMEAEVARTNGTLLPVLLDDVSVPLGFGAIQALDLIGWSGSPSDRRCEHVVGSVSAMLSGQPRPKPRPLVGRRLVISSSALLLALTLAGFANQAGLWRGVCAVLGTEPLCRSLGVRGLPAEGEEPLWRSVSGQASCEGYERYLSAFPGGVHETEARARLASRHDVQEWKPGERELQVALVEVHASEQDARRYADARGVDACQSYPKTGLYKLEGSRVEATLRCEPAGKGAQCRFEAGSKVVCQVQERSTRTLCK